MNNGIPPVTQTSVILQFSSYIFSADISPEMLKHGWVTKVKVLFLVRVFVFNFDLFEFSDAILEKGLLRQSLLFLFTKDTIDKSVKGYLSKVTTTGKDASKCEISNCHFYKLPYISYYSSYTGIKISSIVNKYCKDLNVRIIFSPFKLSTMFSPKDLFPILSNHVLFISLNVRAVELVILVKPINRLFNTCVNEHLFWDKKINSHIFKHLSACQGCRDKCDISCFKILDHASTYSQLKIKESFHNLNS